MQNNLWWLAALDPNSLNHPLDQSMIGELMLIAFLVVLFIILMISILAARELEALWGTIKSLSKKEIGAFTLCVSVTTFIGYCIDSTILGAVIGISLCFFDQVIHKRSDKSILMLIGKRE